MVNAFCMQLQYLFFMIKLIKEFQLEYLKNYENVVND